MEAFGRQSGRAVAPHRSLSRGRRFESGSDLRLWKVPPPSRSKSRHRLFVGPLQEMEGSELLSFYIWLIFHYCSGYNSQTSRTPASISSHFSCNYNHNHPYSSVNLGESDGLSQPDLLTEERNRARARHIRRAAQDSPTTRIC